MEVKDLLGLNEPIVKLIEVFQKGCSWIVSPIQKKRMARADVDASTILSQRDFKNSLMKQLCEDTNLALHCAREKMQYENIACIYSQAAQELQMINDFDASKEVTSEWCALFFDYAKDVSNEDIQIIWSKLLVEEVSHPSTIFKRTLSVLKNLEPFEARWFAELSGFIMEHIFIDILALDEELIAYNKIQTLIDSGLLNAEKCQMQFNCDMRSISCGHYRICWHEKLDKKIVFTGFTLTDAGIQLYEIQQVKPELSYVQKIAERLHSVYNIDCEIVEDLN